MSSHYATSTGKVRHPMYLPRPGYQCMLVGEGRNQKVDSKVGTTRWHCFCGRGPSRLTSVSPSRSPFEVFEPCCFSVLDVELLVWAMLRLRCAVLAFAPPIKVWQPRTPFLSGSAH